MNDKDLPENATLQDLITPSNKGESQVDLLTEERYRRRIVSRNILVVAVARFHHNNAILRACLHPSRELERAIKASTAVTKDEIAILTRVYRFQASQELERAISRNNHVLADEINIAISRLGGLADEW